jgi:hypothetical protein
LAWLVIAPIPAALTFQSPHALRAQNMVIPLTILSAYGLAQTLEFLKRNINRRLILFTIHCSIVTVFSLSFARYLHQYYIHMAKAYPYSSQYGLKELVDFVENDIRKVVVTTRYDQPYILFLFYGVATGDDKFNPDAFQKKHILTGRDKYGFSTVPEYDKYVFKDIDFEADKEIFRGSLIVGTDENIPNEANIIENIYGSNGFGYFQVVAN